MRRAAHQLLDDGHTTFHRVGTGGKRSRLDYALSPSSLSPIERRVFDGLANRVAVAGEPWQAFFEPAALKRDLEAMGFKWIADLGPAEINARYFKDRTDGLRVGSLAHVMNARV
jgi:hypothetical protein